jgi:flagellar hook-associated protein 1 FlgK
VDVKLGGTSGVPLVSANGSNATLSSTTATDGTISFTLGVSPLTLSGGSLAGQQQTLSAAATANATLDGIANSLMSTVNTAQTHGVDLNGTPGTNFFSGAALGAGAIAVALSSGSKIATAPASASAKSLDASNLTALQSSLTSANIAGQMNDLLYSVSSAVAGNTTTRDALDSIYSNAKTTLANQAGVDLDTEAANLVKYQQAFQASGKVIQVSSTLFEQLLQL